MNSEMHTSIPFLAFLPYLSMVEKSDLTQNESVFLNYLVK